MPHQSCHSAPLTPHSLYRTSHHTSPAILLLSHHSPSTGHHTTPVLPLCSSHTTLPLQDITPHQSCRSAALTPHSLYRTSRHTSPATLPLSHHTPSTGHQTTPVLPLCPSHTTLPLQDIRPHQSCHSAPLTTLSLHRTSDHTSPAALPLSQHTPSTGHQTTPVLPLCSSHTTLPLQDIRPHQSCRSAPLTTHSLYRTSDHTSPATLPLSHHTPSTGHQTTPVLPLCPSHNTLPLQDIRPHQSCRSAPLTTHSLYRTHMPHQSCHSAPLTTHSTASVDTHATPVLPLCCSHDALPLQDIRPHQSCHSAPLITHSLYRTHMPHQSCHSAALTMLSLYRTSDHTSPATLLLSRHSPSTGHHTTPVLPLCSSHNTLPLQDTHATPVLPLCSSHDTLPLQDITPHQSCHSAALTTLSLYRTLDHTSPATLLLS
ncbi:mucin-4-like [Haliotis rufescens]|uniref:mucin-4-like n=1 Tax=Haliotis rufescens TaxID=6454 RepID=UPI00201EBA5C|nr:mucin-4-like [Haliotis rufescens]